MVSFELKTVAETMFFYAKPRDSLDPGLKTRFLEFVCAANELSNGSEIGFFTP